MSLPHSVRAGWLRWAPAFLLGLGALLVVGIDTQRTMALRRDLGTVAPAAIGGWRGRDVQMPEQELEVAGASDYLLRYYEAPGSAADSAWISLYVGYYERQVRGKTIHSPKNCLPGAGWAPVQSTVLAIDTPAGLVKVNRYLLQNENRLALVLYWYQGRGRVQANEYVVKWDLLRDAVLRQRTEEALVRVVVPIHDGDQEAATASARDFAAIVIPALWSALPS